MLLACVGLAGSVVAGRTQQGLQTASAEEGAAGKQLGGAGEELGEAGKQLVAVIAQAAASVHKAVQTYRWGTP